MQPTIIGAMLLALVACSSSGENTRTKVGAGAGAATGAVVGGAVGGWKGAAIGGVTGAAAGGVAGRALAIGMGETQPVAANDSPEGGRRIAA